jgi:recombination protein RecT
VPYKGVCTYQLGFKGLIQLARNSGEVKDIRAGLVYEEEKKGGMWNYFEDEKGQHFFHNPSMEKDKGALHCGYSIVTMRDGSNFVHVMEAHRIEAIKKMSLQRTPNSPWANDLFCPEMMKKTVIRRHCKTLPSSVEMALAIEHEETVERGETVKYQTDEINSIIDQMDVSEIETDDLKNEAALKELMK